MDNSNSLTKKTFIILDEAIIVYLFRQKKPTKNRTKLEMVERIKIIKIFNSISIKKIFDAQTIFKQKYKLKLKKINGRKKK